VSTTLSAGGSGTDAPQGFNSDYFSLVYGERRRQSVADALRDRALVRLVRRHAPSPPACGRPALLDVGCGYGYLLERFRDTYDVYGSDVSDHAATRARTRCGVVAVCCGSVEDGIEFDLSFSVVLMVNVLEHLKRPVRALEHVREHLMPGGVCVVHLPTVNNRFNRALYSATYAKDPTHIFRPSGFAVRRLFESAGFALMQESYFPHWPRRPANFLKIYPPYLGVYLRR